MEKPNAVTTNWFTEAIPADPRAVRGQMFGHPCVFVNGNMFLGTFGQSVIARVGEPRATELCTNRGLRYFEPMDGRAWKEYVQVHVNEVPDAELAGLAKDALEHTATLPAKPKKAAKGKAQK